MSWHIKAAWDWLPVIVRAIVLGLLCTGCGTLRSGRAWGENAIYPVDPRSISLAAKRTALDPLTWAPLVGAGVIAAGGWDHSISAWASKETPLFGSRSGAQDYSDIALRILQAEAVATTVLTPSGNDPGQWVLAKARGALVVGAAVETNSLFTDGFKSAIGRERPDRSDHASMPSGHSSGAFGAMALANANLNCIDMNGYARTSLQATNMMFASSVGWARVEGQKHFPTDVLVGAALGNLTTRFIYEAFIGTTPNDKFSFSVEPRLSGGSVTFVRKF